METWHIHLEGQVQGVGFRPFVYLLAGARGLNGRVNNTTDGVHIDINADEKGAQGFLHALLEKAPALARITGHRLYPVAYQPFDDFRIVHSETADEPNLLLTPDFALCPDCRAELYAPKGANRRSGYPFITCTNCGPRYSIVQKLPYDRVNTTMAPFAMCPNCRTEYDNPADRRYYSQTNSCPDCRIELALFDASKKLLESDQEAVIDRIAEAWAAGKIVAIKGIGGYLLTCSAEQASTVQTLRDRKHRPTKPFALMYPGIDAVRAYFDCRPEETAMLESAVAPIVLLQKSGAALPDGIAPGLERLGVMLPYAPLYALLLEKFGGPIVATSGNRSNSPIVYRDEKAFEELSAIADFILLNNREIAVPQDDSVVSFSRLHRQPIILRRSRGLAPTYIQPALKLPPASILATGAMLKSTFSLLHRSNIYISPYLGDLEHFDTQNSYRHTIGHYRNLLNAAPALLLCDKHPDYPSTRYAEQESEALGVPLERIQHHLAHFGAVLGEHDLLHSPEPVLGVIWDGTGLGDDGQVWGGEFFRYEHCDFRRCGHFDYFDVLLGDKMAREPRLSALSACWDLPGAAAVLKEKFSTAEWQLYGKLLEKGAPIRSSSVGRIFDAVASLLRLADKQHYEGEAAMLLENLAARYFQKNGPDFSDNYFTEADPGHPISTKIMMRRIIEDLRQGTPSDFIAAKMHFSLVGLIQIIARHEEIRQLAFSGGTFQNSTLVDLIIHHLQGDFTLYFHRQLSPNDENISFGQLICHQIQQYRSTQS